MGDEEEAGPEGEEPEEKEWPQIRSEEDLQMLLDQGWKPTRARVRGAHAVRTREPEK
jgi:hypothetical protein